MVYLFRGNTIVPSIKKGNKFMKYDREQIDIIVSDIIENDISNRLDNFSVELSGKLRKCKTHNEAIVLSMNEYYFQSLWDTKTIMVETLCRLLNEEK